MFAGERPHRPYGLSIPPRIVGSEAPRVSEGARHAWEASVSAVTGDKVSGTPQVSWPDAITQSRTTYRNSPEHGANALVSLTGQEAQSVGPSAA